MRQTCQFIAIFTYLLSVICNIVDGSVQSPHLTSQRLLITKISNILPQTEFIQIGRSTDTELQHKPNYALLELDDRPIFTQTS